MPVKIAKEGRVGNGIQKDENQRITLAFAALRIEGEPCLKNMETSVSQLQTAEF